MRWFSLLGFMALAMGGPPPKGAPQQIRVPLWLDGEIESRQIQATLLGAKSEVVRLQGPSDDLVLLIVLDLVGDLASIEPAKQALIQQIEQLPPNVHVGLLRAQDGLRVVLDPTTDRQTMADAIRNAPISGMAGLIENVELMGRIADSVLAKSGVRVAVWYVSDSTVAGYREDFSNPVINSSDSGDLSRKFPERLIQERVLKIDSNLARQETPLFIAHLDYRSDRLNEAYQIGLKQLAETTGGNAEFARSRGEISDLIRRMADRIVAHYSVTLALPEQPPRSVDVQLAAEGKTSLTYRTRFVLKER
jgi:hypothetical protein